MDRFPIMPFLLPMIFALLSLTWGGLLWRFPSLYDPESILYRQLYLWYVVWFRKKADESFALCEDEVVRAGRVIFVLGAIQLLIIFLFMMLLK